jgi:anionic cell wall polymer biosynthesis LytR-Cps2A-Psr (LCP) family protein
MRYRGTAGGDMDRMARQQAVLIQLAQNAFKLNNIPNLGRFFDMALEKMDTNLTLNELTAIAAVSERVLDNGIETYVLPGEGKMMNAIWYFIPDIDQLREDLGRNGYSGAVALDPATRTSER